MPRHTHAKPSQKRSEPRDRKGSSGRRLPTQDLDAQVLSLREAGSSYSAIARRLELSRATDAHRSFIRALGSQEGAHRRQLVDNEVARLDQLEQRIRDRDAPDAAKIERRLRGVTNLREAVRQ
jgi:DNA-binding transcriptional MerR regulator